MRKEENNKKMPINESKVFNTAEELDDAYDEILVDVIKKWGYDPNDERIPWSRDEEEINEESYEIFEKKYGISFEEEYERLNESKEPPIL